MLHDTVAFSVEGTPLGILDAQCWARDPDEHGKSEERKKRPIEEKESVKWLNSFTRVAEVQALCPQTVLVSLGDRESDIPDLFALAARDPAGPKLLVRAERTRQRRVENEALWDFISRQSPTGEITLHLPRRGNRPARTVVLPVRFAAVTLQPPGAAACQRLTCGRFICTKRTPTIPSRSSGCCSPPCRFTPSTTPWSAPSDTPRAGGSRSSTAR